MSNIRKDYARRDEACVWCGYPFDTGDRMLVDVDHGEPLCSWDCATKNTEEWKREDSEVKP